VKVERGQTAWLRRLCVAAAAVVAAMVPGQAAGRIGGQPCLRLHCETAGTIRWQRPLPGSWLAQGGLTGTAPAGGQAFAALGGQVAAVGTGLTVYAYDAGTGQPLWTDHLTGFPAGARIVSVRAWAGIVTAGVAIPVPTGATPVARAARRAGGLRYEVVLRAGSGQRLGAHPAAPFGGAVAAGRGAMVIVGARSVTSYSDRTGQPLWSRGTGALPQAWQVDGDRIYVTVAAKGYLGTAPVTALRRIDLRSGAERLVRPDGHGFGGTLSLAFGGVLLFSNSGGVAAYSGASGELLWRRTGVLPDTVDASAGLIYLINGRDLLGVDPETGLTRSHVPGVAAGASSGLYGARAGTVLGLDRGAPGKAWGYSAATQRIVWTSRPLPWPHYFVDLSGIGGSAPPAAATVLLATCARLGQRLPGNAGQLCARPELVLLNR
jgi:outer membrane protein assembly factor BamB